MLGGSEGRVEIRDELNVMSHDVKVAYAKWNTTCAAPILSLAND